MGKFTQKSTGAIREFEKAISLVPEVVTTEIEQKITDPVISSVNNVVQFVDREVEVIKEVPVYIEKEVIKYVDRVEVKFVDVVKEIEKIVHVPVDIVREVDRKVVTFVDKVPYWMWMLSAMELLTIIILIIK